MLVEHKLDKNRFFVIYIYIYAVKACHFYHMNKAILLDLYRTLYTITTKKLLCGKDIGELPQNSQNTCCEGCTHVYGMEIIETFAICYCCIVEAVDKIIILPTTTIIICIKGKFYTICHDALLFSYTMGLPYASLPLRNINFEHRKNKVASRD